MDTVPDSLQEAWSPINKDIKDILPNSKMIYCDIDLSALYFQKHLLSIIFSPLTNSSNIPQF